VRNQPISFSNHDEVYKCVFAANIRASSTLLFLGNSIRSSSCRTS